MALIYDQLATQTASYELIESLLMNTALLCQPFYSLTFIYLCVMNVSLFFYFSKMYFPSSSLLGFYRILCSYLLGYQDSVSTKIILFISFFMRVSYFFLLFSFFFFVGVYFSFIFLIDYCLFSLFSSNNFTAS